MISDRQKWNELPYEGILRCIKCGYRPIKNKDERKIHFHHLTPKAFGGTDKEGRIQLCEECHKKLHKMFPIKKNDRYTKTIKRRGI